jgi:hypothetical protein
MTNFHLDYINFLGRKMIFLAGNLYFLAENLFFLPGNIGYGGQISGFVG